MESLTLATVFAALGAGVASFFSPCTLPVLPVYIALLASDSDGEERSLGARMANALAFAAGISVVFVTLGFGAGALGRVLGSPAFTAVCGLLVVFMGANLLGAVSFPFLEREWRPGLAKAKDGGGVAGSFLLGLAFSLGWTPCVGPFLASVLALVAQQGGSLAGAALLAVYSLGFALPFVVLSVGAGAASKHLDALKRYAAPLRVVGGAAIVAMGLWMVVTSFTANQQADAPNVQASGESVAYTADEEGEPSQTDDEALQEAAFFVLRTLDGKTVSLDDYAGRPVVVKIWGTWCPPCMAGLEGYQEFAKEANETGMAYVTSIVIPGISGEKSEEDFKAWYAEEGMTLPVLLDDGSFVRRIGLSAFPTYLFYDSEGTFLGGRIGDTPVDELKQIVAEISGAGTAQR